MDREINEMIFFKEMLAASEKYIKTLCQKDGSVHSSNEKIHEVIYGQINHYKGLIFNYQKEGVFYELN